MLNIISGKQKRAVKLVITGSEGIGKSTLASKAPGALFIDTEGGSAQLDIRRIAGITTWTDLVSVPSEILKDPSLCKTLVLDTADWAEAMCIKHICSKFKVNGLESFGYGKGYTYLYEEFSSFLGQLNKLIDAGINVIIIAHAKLKKQELPDEQGAFDRWEMKLTRQVAPLIKEWGDAVLFCNYKTTVIATENSTHKATGGKRVLYTTHHPCWDAKNRFGLADELPLEFDSIKGLFLTDSAEPDESAYQRLTKQLEENGISESELQAVVARKGKYSAEVPVSEYEEAFITGWILPNLSRIKELAVKGRSQNN